VVNLLDFCIAKTLTFESWSARDNQLEGLDVNFEVRVVTKSIIIATIDCPDIGYCLFGISLVMHIPYLVPFLLL